MRGGRIPTAAVVAAVLVGCASRPASVPPPPLPPGAVPGLQASSRVLDAPAVALDALDPSALRDLLERSGYVVGRERSFSGGRGDVRAVVARVLVFEDATGASGYLRWVLSHVEDLLGPSDALEPLPTGSRLFRSRPSGCCPKETRTYLTAWRRGERVLWLLVSGPGVSREGVGALAARLDAQD